MERERAGNWDKNQHNLKCAARTVENFRPNFSMKLFRFAGGFQKLTQNQRALFLYDQIRSMQQKQQQHHRAAKKKHTHRAEVRERE